MLDEPAVIKNGNKYGVRIKAQVPSINMLKTNINVEIAPIVGNKNQADDLIEYIKDNTKEFKYISCSYLSGRVPCGLLGQRQFKYISCSYLSVTSRVKSDNGVIQIHLMFLFIKTPDEKTLLAV